LLVAIIAFSVSFAGASEATVIEVGDLNIIDDPGNPSDGLRFLDMTYSDGLTLAAALTNAQASYPDARLASPSEWDDLLAGAGVVYGYAGTASDAFLPGSSDILASGQAPVLTLISQLGATQGNGWLYAWSDPDGDTNNLTTRDYLALFTDGSAWVFQSAASPPDSDYGWLLVTQIPEPSTALLVATGLIGLAAAGRRRSLH
jgi:hypothetical protein